MNVFCTHCGASLSAGTAFCNACGLEVSPPVVPTQDKIHNQCRTRWWVLAIVVFFLLGVLLGRLFGPKCPECPGGASSGGAGAAASGRGQPLQPGVGKAPVGGKPVSGPADADAGGGASKIDPPDGSGKIIPHDLTGADVGGGGVGERKADTDNAPPDHAPHMTVDEQKLEGDVALLAAGKPLYGTAQAPPTAEPTLGKKSFIARDFTYDKTNLPRYPTGVSVVASSVSYVITLKTGDHTGAYGTGAGIVTTSSFGDVVAWYQSNVPPGWQSTTIGDFSQLAQRAKTLSGDKIMQLLLGQTGETTRAGNAAAAPVPNISMSLFKPPGVAAATQNSSIMIIQEEGKPVTVYLQSKVD